jgi:L-rhamnose-H+ transport protein
MISGLIMLVIAGICQGLFVLPLSFTKNWKWEHNWLLFSFFGMIVLNWLLAFMFFPQVISVYQDVPISEIYLLMSFGLLWGIGAILFGIGMEKLGLSIGYPVIMGLIASTGTLLPLIIAKPESILTFKGLALLVGSLLVVAGIFICSRATSLKYADSTTAKSSKSNLTTGIITAVLAGLLSALPNIGMTFATKTISTAAAHGITSDMASNVVWLLFFTVGFAANAIYTIYLIIRHRSGQAFVRSFSFTNILWIVFSASCWIGSFYLYGISARKLGEFGAIVGWPLFISIAIVVGNIAGIWNGEWKDAPARSVKVLRYGMLVFIVAMITIGLSNFLN